MKVNSGSVRGEFRTVFRGLAFPPDEAGWLLCRITIP